MLNDNENFSEKYADLLEEIKNFENSKDDFFNSTENDYVHLRAVDFVSPKGEFVFVKLKDEFRGFENSEFGVHLKNKNEQLIPLREFEGCFCLGFLKDLNEQDWQNILQPEKTKKYSHSYTGKRISNKSYKNPNSIMDNVRNLLQHLVINKDDNWILLTKLK